MDNHRAALAALKDRVGLLEDRLRDAEESPALARAPPRTHKRPRVRACMHRLMDDHRNAHDRKGYDPKRPNGSDGPAAPAAVRHTAGPGPGPGPGPAPPRQLVDAFRQNMRILQYDKLWGVFVGAANTADMSDIRRYFFMLLPKTIPSLVLATAAVPPPR